MSNELEKFYHELQRFRIVDKKEERKILREVQTGNKTALDQLVKANLRFVVAVAKKYLNRGLALVDLIGAGNMGLVIAAKKYKSSYHNKFISYAVWWIRQAIIRALYEQAPIIRIPSYKALLLEQFRTDLRKNNGDWELTLAKRKYSRHRQEIKDLLFLNNTLSLDHKTTDFEEHESDHNFINVLKYESNTEKWIENESAGEKVESMFRNINNRQRQIIKYYYGIGINKPFTLRQIGEKLNLSKERVRQIKRDAIKRLIGKYRGAHARTARSRNDRKRSAKVSP